MVKNVIVNECLNGKERYRTKKCWTFNFHLEGIEQKTCTRLNSIMFVRMNVFETDYSFCWKKKKNNDASFFMCLDYSFWYVKNIMWRHVAPFTIVLSFPKKNFKHSFGARKNLSQKPLFGTKWFFHPKKTFGTWLLEHLLGRSQFVQKDLWGRKPNLL